MKYVNYTLITLGAIITFYANSAENTNQYVLIIGIVMLMTGIYRISKKIPSKQEEDDNVNDSN